MALSIRVAADGYAFLPRHKAVSDILSVATEIGEPIIPWDNAVVQHLIPRANSTPNTYSGIFGLGSFPFHTDLAHWRRPPRYILLRCVKGFKDVPTLLVDGREIVQALTPDFVRRAIVRPRRPLSGEMRLLRLLHADESEGVMFRWDEVYLKPASRIAELAFDKVRGHLETATVQPMPMVDAGDMLVVDNWRMLHSRPAILAGREDRHLERVYMERLN